MDAVPALVLAAHYRTDVRRFRCERGTPDSRVTWRCTFYGDRDPEQGVLDLSERIKVQPDLTYGELVEELIGPAPAVRGTRPTAWVDSRDRAFNRTLGEST